MTLLASFASAVAIDVRWDDPNFGGFGVSAATAASAQSAGIPIIQLSAVALNNLTITHALDGASVVIPTPVGNAPATATSNWTATNNTGSNTGAGPLENLYLIFARPGANTIFLNGQPQTVNYDPADVGLTLRSGEGGVNWVILQVPSEAFDLTSVPVYYPAVSLGTLGNSALAAFQLNYTLANPQVYNEAFNFELGIPQWNLFSASTPIPEPSTGLLILVGLGAIAGARRARP